MERFSEDIIKLFEIFKEETGKYKDLNLEKVEFEGKELKEIAEKIKAGGTPSTSNPEYWHDNFEDIDNENFFGWRDINKDLFSKMYIDKYTKVITKKGYKKSSTWLVPENSILLAIASNSKGLLTISKVPMCINQNILGIVIDHSKYDVRYVYFFLKNHYSKLTQKGFGNLTKRSESKVKVLVPKPLRNYTSYDIQKAIADFIEFVTLKSEEIQKLMDEIISKTALLRKTLLVKLFTKLPYKKRNGKEDLTDLFKLFDEVFKKEFREYKDLNLKKVKFKKEELGNIAKEIINGFAYGKSVDEGLPHLRPNNIGEDGNLNFLKVKYIPNNEKKKRKLYLLKAGDILFNNTNSIDLVGKTCYINSDMEAVFSNHITRIRVKEDYDSKYLALNLQSLFISGYFKNIATRWVNQAGINIERLKETKIPIPEPLENSYTSYDIQKAIANFVEFITERHIKTLKEIQELSDKLEKYLLKKFFKAVSEASNDGKSK